MPASQGAEIQLVQFFILVILVDRDDPLTSSTPRDTPHEPLERVPLRMYLGSIPTEISQLGVVRRTRTS